MLIPSEMSGDETGIVTLDFNDEGVKINCNLNGVKCDRLAEGIAALVADLVIKLFESKPYLALDFIATLNEYTVDILRDRVPHLVTGMGIASLMKSMEQEMN